MIDLERLGHALADARRRSGLDQATAAERVGVNRITLSRHENGKGGAPGTDVLQRYADAYGITVDELMANGGNGAGSKNVSRGTRSASVPAEEYERAREPIPRQFQIMAKEFEVEALKLGAEEAEMDYIRMALDSPETARMFAYGHRSREGVSEEALKADYQALINALRTYVKMRVKARNEAKRRS